MNGQPSSRNPQAVPVPGDVPAPVWLFAMLALLLFWGMLYLDEHGGGFHPQVFEPHRSFAALKDMQPRGAGDDLLLKGQKAYSLYCVGCHMDNGLGNPFGGIPPLAGSEWVIGEGPNRLVRIVLNSVQGPITVKGQVYNNSSMPQWRDVIADDHELAALVTFVRGNKDWGHAASAVTAAQVSAIREETKGRTTQWTAAELEAVPEK